MLTSSQATLTFAADMNEPVMANTPVAPRTDTMIKAIVNGVTTPPDKIQLATWDNTLPESNAREIENDMARRTELEEASSANGGVEATNGQEGTYVRGASKPPMAYGVPLEIGPNGVGSKDNGTHYQLFDGAHIRKMMIDAPQTTSLTIHFSVFYIPHPNPDNDDSSVPLPLLVELPPPKPRTAHPRFAPAGPQRQGATHSLLLLSRARCVRWHLRR
ncbi:peptidase S1 domain-containing protein [Pseudoscourfieldia marina]